MYRHYPDIDVLKGITILLVILGHSFCTTPINIFGMLPVMGDVVRSFQMPLFFVVSGFLFSSTGGLKLLLKKKNKSLVLSLSHDIKTPLGVIELYSKALEKGLYKEEEKKKKIQEIKDARKYDGIRNKGKK